MVRALHITATPFLNESRVLRETDSLVRSGLYDEIVVIALHQDGLPESARIDERRQLWRVRLRSRAWPRSLLWQCCKYIELSVRVWKYAFRGRFHTVNVHSLELLPLGVLLKVTLRTRLVYDAHELETEVDGLAGLRQRMARAIERRSIRFADLIIVVSDGIRDWYRSTYGLHGIVTVLNSPRLQEPPVSDILRKRLGIADERKLVLYQGGLVSGRGVEALLAAFEYMGDRGMDLVFLGYGALEEHVRDVTRRCPTIHLLPAVQPSELLQYTASADIGVAIIENTCQSYYLCLPNKLFEYVMARIPVLVSNMPEMARLVELNRIGKIAIDLSPRSITEALAAIGRMDGETLRQDLDAVAARHSWERQEAVMISAYRQVVVA